ncbi:hypothetical protein Xvie_03986 [Xenorhabdus vietnamensis]|uniref:DUF3969 family protein n=1 Tax=Xenorhabdus vietnamensis TaxID=351656 RepID=A0A1Y2S995_9GAMM|nr:DUF3969 family protein [Xenorhabdus vietnamensis]OTA14111.1 hypothetical protein Xvie_03986 [Xenorhabdus vietnamensis]
MKLCYCIEKKHAEKFVSILVLGLLHSLDKKLISIDEAEGFIFMPYVPNVLKKIKASDELINIINLGCELEDVASLIPKELPASINELIEKTLLVIKNNDEIGRLVEKEILIKGKGRRE